MIIIPYGDDQVKGGYFPLFSYALIAINLAVFFYEASLPLPLQNAFMMKYAAIPAHIMQGEDLYTLITSMFLHGGWVHLFGNMLFLWIFADNIEALIGTPRFFTFYFLGGLAAHVAHIYFNLSSEIPTVGASGAISAVMGAYLMLFPGFRIHFLLIIIPFRIPAFLFLFFWVFQQLLNGQASLRVQTAESSGVAWWAHIGGFVFGVLAGIWFRLTLRRSRPPAPAAYRRPYR